MVIIAIVIAFLVAGFVDATLREKYKIERNKSFSDQFFNKWHMLFEIFAALAFLAVISTYGLTNNVLYSVLIMFFAFLYVIRAALEFTFRRAQNKYKISVIYVIIFAFLSVAIYLFL